LVSDIHITDGVTEEATGATLHTAGATRDIGDQDGVIQDTDLTTDTITTLIVMEEEVLPLITEEETMVMIEAIATETTAIEATAIEATAATEATLTEISAIETTLQTEEIIQQTETGILILEEVLQTEELIILQAQISQTEEVLLRDKAIVTTILTEDQAATQQPEITTAVITAHQQEATLLAHHVL